jgi:hypothetical protein
LHVKELSGEGDTRTQGGSVQPTDAVAFRNPFPGAVPKAPLLRWVASNIVRLTLYLALASLSIAGYAVLAENAGSATLLGPSVIYFLLRRGVRDPRLHRLAVGCCLLPTGVVYASASSHGGGDESTDPADLARGARLLGLRIAAAVVGLLLPAGSAFVVRFRERRPSSPWPPEDGGEQEPPSIASARQM